jgi:Spy/CpxP family protein refolding chaperone
MRFTSMMLMAAAATGPLVAQQPDTTMRAPMRMGEGGGMMGGMDMMDHMREMGGMSGPLLRGMLLTPANLLMHKEVLGLTEEQVAKLTALRDAAKTSHDAAASDARTHGHELATLMGTTAPDTAQLKTHFEAMQAATTRAEWAMIVAAAQARAVLTETQRARVDGWGDAMDFMMRMQGEPEHGGEPGMMMHSHSE